jgi:pseudaminic acid cytidylyltransferase
MKVAIIPARGGSKRIPGKNIKNFYGKPMISYPIRAALNSGIFDRVIVTTDDPQIASVAREFGAETPFLRPDELANDYTTTVPVIKHAIEWLNNNQANVGYACCIYATAPFVQPKYLISAFNKFVEDSVKGYVFTATKFSFPIQRAFKINKDSCVEMFQPSNYSARSQDLEESYQDAGQFYWGAGKTFLEEKIFFSSDSKAYVLPQYLVQDIDTLEDWRRAEIMFEVLKRNGDLVEL